MSSRKDVEKKQINFTGRSQRLAMQRSITGNVHQIAKMASANHVKCISVYERKDSNEVYKIRIDNEEMIIEMPAIVAPRTVSLLKDTLKNKECEIVYERENFNGYVWANRSRALGLKRSNKKDGTDDGSGTGKRHGRINNK